MQSPKTICILLAGLACSSCAVLLKSPTTTQTVELATYKFIVVESTPSNFAVSGSGTHFSSKNFSPSNYLEGLLLKRGIIRVTRETSPNLAETLLLRWGVSGRRDIALGLGGYTQEITFALLTALDLKPIYQCSAEGIGFTEADDVREALNACMSALR